MASFSNVMHVEEGCGCKYSAWSVSCCSTFRFDDVTIDLLYVVNFFKLRLRFISHRFSNLFWKRSKFASVTIATYTFLQSISYNFYDYPHFPALNIFLLFNNANTNKISLHFLDLLPQSRKKTARKYQVVKVNKYLPGSTNFENLTFSTRFYARSNYIRMIKTKPLRPRSQGEK